MPDPPIDNVDSKTKADEKLNFALALHALESARVHYPPSVMHTKKMASSALARILELEAELQPIAEAALTGCYAVPVRHGAVFWKPRLSNGDDIPLERIVSDDKPFGYGTIAEALAVANEEERKRGDRGND